MYVSCDCGCTEFHIRFEPPANAHAECVDCGETREIGGGRVSGRTVNGP